MLGFRSDADGVPLLQAGVADQTRGQHQGVVVLRLEDDGRAAIEEAVPAVDGRGLLEFAVGDTADGTSDCHGSAMSIVSLAAHLELYGRANTRRDTRGDRFWIAQ